MQVVGLAENLNGEEIEIAEACEAIYLIFETELPAMILACKNIYENLII